MREQDTERIAVEVLRQCEASGAPVTVHTVERVLHQLQAHRPDCQCTLCPAARTVAADRVYATVAGWPRATRRRRQPQ